MATSGATVFAANLLLARILNGTAGTFPATGYVALFSVAPTDLYTSGTPTGTELTTAVLVGYARQPIGMGTSTGFTTPSGGSANNSATINYGTAGTGSVTVTDWGLFDALTAGNLLFWADLQPSQLVAVGNPYSFAIGALVISMV